MSMSVPRPVVVGVDGSSASLAAVGYGLRLAEQRSAPLHLVHAYQYPLPGYTMAGFMHPPEFGAEAMREEIARTLRDLVEQIRRDHPELVGVHSEQISGPAVGVLVELARAADVMVLGTRGHGGFAGLILGSVATQVTVHAKGTVIVVPPDGRDAAELAEGPITVGYDGSRGSGQALRFAAREARFRDGSLTVTRLYDPVIDRNGEYAVRSVGEAVKILADEFPDVRVDAEAPASESAALGLVEISASAGLTVVGARGHGGFAGLLLGSVCRTLVDHARGPVAVVHPTAKDGKRS